MSQRGSDIFPARIDCVRQLPQDSRHFLLKTVYEDQGDTPGLSVGAESHGQISA